MYLCVVIKNAKTMNNIQGINIANSLLDVMEDGREFESLIRDSRILLKKI